MKGTKTRIDAAIIAAIIFSIFTSCQNVTTTENTSSIRSELEGMDILWTHELESVRLKSDYSRTEDVVNNFPLTPTVLAATNSYEIWPILPGFGSLNNSAIEKDLSQFINDFLGALKAESFETLEALTKKESLWSLVLFLNDAGLEIKKDATQTEDSTQEDTDVNKYNEYNGETNSNSGDVDERVETTDSENPPPSEKDEQESSDKNDNDKENKDNVLKPDDGDIGQEKESLSVAKDFNDANNGNNTNDDEGKSLDAPLQDLTEKNTNPEDKKDTETVESDATKETKVSESAVEETTLVIKHFPAPKRIIGEPFFDGAVVSIPVRVWLPKKDDARDKTKELDENEKDRVIDIMIHATLTGGRYNLCHIEWTGVVGQF